MRSGLGMPFVQLRVLSGGARSVLVRAAAVESAASAPSRAGGCRRPGREWTLGGVYGFRSAASAMAPIKVTAGRDRPELPSRQSSQCSPCRLSGGESPSFLPSGPLRAPPDAPPAVLLLPSATPRGCSPPPILASSGDSYPISWTAPKALEPSPRPLFTSTMRHPVMCLHHFRRLNTMVSSAFWNHLLCHRAPFQPPYMPLPPYSLVRFCYIPGHHSSPHRLKQGFSLKAPIVSLPFHFSRAHSHSSAESFIPSPGTIPCSWEPPPLPFHPLLRPPPPPA